MVNWPDVKFGPVNLWTLISADMFYASPEKQWKRVWQDPKAYETTMAPCVHRHAYRMPEIMRQAFASR